MNWVKLRLACNSEKIYHSVVEQVKSDVDEMNNAASRIHFETLEEGRTFIIVPEGHNVDSRGIARLKCNSHTIHVTNDARHIDDFFIKWAWNQNTASCDLSVNGEKMKLWEISQKALYPVFFPGDVDIRAPVS